MLQWPLCLHEGVERLSTAHFSQEQNKLIYGELSEQWKAGKPVELLIFTHHLREKKLLDRIGGAYYLTHTFTSYCHSPTAFDYYVQILGEELAKRELVKIASKVSKTDLRGHEDPVGQTITQLSEIPKSRGKIKTNAELMTEKIERMEHGQADSDVIKTGLTLLDERSPIRKGDFPLIAGQRKAGKSVLALTIAVNVARNGVPVLYFSLEDRQPKVMDRLFAGVSRIPMSSHHIHKLTDRDMTAAVKAAGIVKDLPLAIRDDVLDLNSIIAVARQYVARGQAELICIDYAQLVRAKSDSRREEVEKVSRDLRLLAMELNVPVILLCQLNKEGETRETKALEMDCTALIEIQVEEDEPNKRWIAVPFQRNGESSIRFPVTFCGAIARVENFQKDTGF